MFKRTKLALCSVTFVCLFAPTVNADVIHASTVEDFSQGLKKGGGKVKNNRSDPLNALGAPQINDTLNFVSLGFGGSITLGFEESFSEFVTVWETTYGNPSNYPEAAEIFVGYGETWDAAQYYSLGIMNNYEDGEPILLDNVDQLSGQTDYQFLRVVDATDRGLHNNGADGFDVDGVGAHAAVPGPASLSLLIAAGLMGHRGGRNRRRRA